MPRSAGERKIPSDFFFHNGIFHLPSTQNFQKVNITYPLTRTGTRTYQVVRNVIFSENECAQHNLTRPLASPTHLGVTYLLNDYTLIILTLLRFRLCPGILQ